MKKAARVSSSYLFLLILLALLLVAWQKRFSLWDWWRLRGYSPPGAITALAEQDTMTPAASHIFYVNHPSLVDQKATFRQDCPTTEQTIVLGCYRSLELGIYVYNVSDPRLSGVQQVTAAHEMLHGAYDRLSSSDKKYINGLLVDYYDHNLQDQRIQNTMKAYKQTEPGDLVNEMHSVFGTEVANLPAPLEAYYKRYFDNRQQIVNYSNQYESVFLDNQNQIKALDTQIGNLNQQLKIEKQAIDSEETALGTERQRLDQLRQSGSVAEYNAAVGPYNSRVEHLRTLIATYNDDVRRINQLIEQYNQLALLQDSLIQSIDTRVETRPTQ